jgi:hypothetical protein
MERGPRERAGAGDRIEVSVDPRGLVDPVAAERLGWTTVPTVILVVCYAVTALGALVAVVVALLVRPSPRDSVPTRRESS